MKDYLLSTSKIWQGVLGRISSHVTDWTHQIDPLYTKVLRSQNSLQVCFRKRSKFDKKIPVIGNLLDEIDSKKEEKKHIKKIQTAADTDDLDLENRLRKLRNLILNEILISLIYLRHLVMIILMMMIMMMMIMMIIFRYLHNHFLHQRCLFINCTTTTTIFINNSKKQIFFQHQNLSDWLFRQDYWKVLIWYSK